MYVSLADNDLFEKDREANKSKEFVGQKEIPNVKINCLEYDYDNHVYNVLYSYFITTAEGYYEEYDSEKDWKVTISTPVLSLLAYENLIQHHRFCIDTEEIYREAGTNVDKKICHHIRYFNHINIKHKVYSDGAPTVWYITLSNQSHKPDMPILINEGKNKNQESNEKSTPKILRNVQSDSLGDVKL